MVIIAISHRDWEAASRLFAWIKFLGQTNDKLLLMLAEPVWKTPGRGDILEQEAAGAFKQVVRYDLPPVKEKEWPIPQNEMFLHSLNIAERDYPGEWLFWMEPDCVPVTPDWHAVLCAERDAATAVGKMFCGAMVKLPGIDVHMTGNAWYGPQWRAAAPSIAKSTYAAWDIHAAKEIIQNVHWTEAIYHEWRKTNHIRVHDLPQPTVLYHQCKTGHFIRHLNAELYDGLFEPIETTHQPAMTKFYTTSNTRRRIESAGIIFKFEATEFFGGSWYGVYTTDDPQEQDALALLVTNPRMGVKEVSEDDYWAAQKKRKPVKPVFQLSVPFTPPPLPMLGRGGAVVVERGASEQASRDIETATPGPEARDLDDMLKLGTVQSAGPIVGEPKPQGRKGKGHVVE